ncbi:hypothetical protein CRV24_007127 [Beauveria bassiana]|nr:hypothetical protein CRV24_007127 [Beauveria bassiana]KAH8712707.1 hypothetical protein HC256_005882 [Beauveria bassiana]
MPGILAGPFPSAALFVPEADIKNGSFATLRRRRRGACLSLHSLRAKRPAQLLVQRVGVVPAAPRQARQLVDAPRRLQQALAVANRFFEARKRAAAERLALRIRQNRDAALELLCRSRGVLARVAPRRARDDHVRRVLGIGTHLDGAAARGVAEAEAPDGRRVVAPRGPLLGVESHALPDERRLRARCAPRGVGHLEAHREGAVGAQLGGARAESVLAVQRVAARGALVLGRHVLAHVEALHDGGWAREVGAGPPEG